MYAKSIVLDYYIPTLHTYSYVCSTELDVWVNDDHSCKHWAMQ